MTATVICRGCGTQIEPDEPARLGKASLQLCGVCDQRGKPAPERFVRMFFEAEPERPAGYTPIIACPQCRYRQQVDFHADEWKCPGCGYMIVERVKEE